jgi:endonuclease-3
MPTSRLSKETSKYFSNTADQATSILPRRSTRSSLARFAYTATPPTVKDEDDSSELSELSFGSDIEDAIKAPASSYPQLSNGTASIRKRKRATTLTTTSSTPKTKVKLEASTELDFTTLPSPSPAKPRRVRKPARTTTGLATTQPPSDWEEIYRLVKEMRVSGPASNAAVDTMGCERLAGKDGSPKEKRFHTLVALMLSSQTKDTVTAETMGRLMRELPACAPGKPVGLNLENMLAVEPEVLNGLIGKVGFHNNKTKYLASFAVSTIFYFLYGSIY